jgi:hypothetical protein
MITLSMLAARLHPKSKSILLSVLAMVLYTGKDTRVFNLSLKDSPYMSRRKLVKTTFSIYIDLITYLLLFVGILASAFVYLSFFSRRSQYHLSLWLDSEYLYLGEWQKYFQALGLCCSLIPIHLNVLQEITLFVASIKIHAEASKAIVLSKEEVGAQSTREELDTHTFERQNNLENQVPKIPQSHFFQAPPRSMEKIHSDFNLLAGNAAKTPARHSYVHRSATPKKRRFTGADHFSSAIISTTPRSDSQPGITVPDSARQLKENSELQKSQSQRFLPGEPMEPVKLPDAFGVQPTAFAHVTNYSVVSELGNIDHLLLDKTDTLTENLLDIKSLATWRRSYNVDLGRMKHIKDEFKKNPEAHRPDDIRDFKGPQEDEFYSEKSQEQMGDLDEQITDEMFAEDPEFKKVVENIRLPFYMPVPVGYAEEQEMKQHNQSGEEDSEESMISAHGSRAGKLSSKIEQLLTTKAKGRFDIEKIEQLIFHSKKDNFGEGEDIDEKSEEEEDPQTFGEGILNPRPFEGFFYDNHARSPDMENLVSTLALFLFCGMVSCNSLG